MRKNTLKVAVVGVLAGTVFQFGCSFGTLWNAFIQAAPIYGLMEFVLDNDGIFDLFEDGNVAAAE
jgi:hypothetical protein